ncbi:hypothetical protein GMORB2_7595 [Geosmithia morbida]|uniref:Uncharacterized protein n=1 Tax=Geosmithia morbida TaxID=1094350 RepID=A0A9P4YUE1_9HYPO|nr:uncharacterized protein GMORB2_7595 [Geosmithia morbida]KAF4122002.1 hypothetical protein GMORB2_7595 [Geosmithia morbida]
MTDYERISRQAETDLSTPQAYGNNRNPGITDAGVDSKVEKKFPSANVATGDELSTNAGFNKRIPPSEGGELDDHGRQTRGEHFEGRGGPEHISKQKPGGDNDNDVVSARVPQVHGEGSVNDIATQGKTAAIHNVGTKPPGPGGQKYPADDYYVPESVPDSISAEGNVAPESVVQASGEAEHPDSYGPVKK